MFDNDVISSYVNFMTDLLVIDDVYFCFDEDISKEYIFDGGAAKCFPQEREIYFDLSKCNDIIQALILITHELRHMYQYDICNQKDYDDFEDFETYESWKNNFNTYISVGDDGYETQPLEVDAEVFTYYIMNKLFKVETNGMLNLCVYKKRYDEILDNLTMEEILESLNYSGFIDYINDVNNDIRNKIVN